VFFFEKKNQKTFIRLGNSLGQTGDGLFVSFSSEKEESFSLMRTSPSPVQETPP